MNRNLFEFNERRALRRIDFGDEILEKPTAAEDADGREIPREARHRLKLFRDNNDFHFVKVDGPLPFVKNAAELFLHPIFHSLDP